MTIARARIVKAAAGMPTEERPTPRVRPPAGLSRRVPRAAMDARDEAERIVADAKAKADALVAEARTSVDALVKTAADDARQAELARVAAELLTVRAAEERRREAELDRTIELALAVAERIIGEGLRLEPERIAVLAAEALRETRGARRVRIEASPDDVPHLTSALATLGADVAEVAASSELGRGSLVVVTELGRVDARLGPQLARLSGALREALAAGNSKG